MRHPPLGGGLLRAGAHRGDGRGGIRRQYGGVEDEPLVRLRGDGAEREVRLGKGKAHERLALRDGGRPVGDGEVRRGEEEFERLSKKHYRKSDDSPNFDADYFKTTDKKQKQKSQQQQTSSRTFRTADGITITDHRTQNQNKKIFAQDEGEYVDFKEN